MARDCVLLGVAVDPLALYSCRDPDALAFVKWLVDAVAEVRRQERAEAEEKMNAVQRGR